MKLFLTLIAITLCIQFCNAQVKSQGDYASDTDDFYFIVDEMPQFNGGEEALLKYLSDSLQGFIFEPQESFQASIQLSFIIEKDGTVSNVRTITGIESRLDKYAIRVVQQMPKWNPGKKDGKPARTAVILPVRF